MIKVTFKNLEKSELARDVAIERLEVLLDKFPDLRQSRIVVTLEMQNSPAQAGPDLFVVKFQVSGGRYSGVFVEKSSTSLYVALADIVDHMLEALNRHSDKIRVKERNSARKFAEQIQQNLRRDET